MRLYYLLDYGFFWADIVSAMWVETWNVLLQKRVNIRQISGIAYKTEMN